MKTKCERQQKVELLKGQPIEEIVKEQNMLHPVERWMESKIMSPSAYLAVAVYFFLLQYSGPEENGGKPSSSRLVQNLQE